MDLLPFKDINKSSDNFMKNTLWMWLPFYALLLLCREVKHKRNK
jgi:hypothetical protein